MTFEIDPPDEPCPDCGSAHHRVCFTGRCPECEGEMKPVDMMKLEDGVLYECVECIECGHLTPVWSYND